jgi:hypothetical protein
MIQSDTQSTTILGLELKEKVAALQSAILAAHPTMPVLLRTIHTLLKKDPENVTLLSEEDISVIVSGLKKQTLTEITTAALNKGTGTKSLKKLTLLDL